MSQLPFGFPKELQDVTVLAAKLVEGINEAKADDGKISGGEAVSLALSLGDDVVHAVKGMGEIMKEVRLLDKAKLDLVYFDFLTRMNWQPSDNTRDLWSIYYDVASAIIIGVIKRQNTLNPPKAEIVPE